MCIKNHADLPRPWTEVLTSQVVANRTNQSFHVCLNERGKETGASTNDMATTCKKEKTRGLSFSEDKKHEFKSTYAGLKS